MSILYVSLYINVINTVDMNINLLLSHLFDSLRHIVGIQYGESSRFTQAWFAWKLTKQKKKR